MNSPTSTVHDDKINSLAATYTQQGFTVVKEPASNELPFDLGDYRPDLVATKGDTGLVIEVKTTTSRMSVDRLRSIADEVSRHAGWRFLLVTLEDIESSRIPTTNIEFPTWSQLISKLNHAQDMIQQGLLEAALLFLWSIFEAALRKRAIAQSIPVERLPPSMLLNHMYSQGEVSVEDIDLLREFMIKRNRTAHGVNESIEPELVVSIHQCINRIVTDWAAQAS